MPADHPFDTAAIAAIDPADVARRVLADVGRARVSTHELVSLCLATLVAEELAGTPNTNETTGEDDERDDKED